MMKLTVHIAYFLGILLLSSCSAGTYIVDGGFKGAWSLKKSPSYSIKEKSLNTKTKIKNRPPEEIIPILSLDRIQTLVITAAKARSRVELVGTARKFKVNAASNFGLAPELDDPLRSGADVSVNLEKALVDQGQIGLEEKSGILAYEQSLLELQIAIDQEIGKSLRAQNELAKFRRVKRVFDHYEKLYQDQKPLLDASWQSGVIGRSDLNKIEQSRLKLLKSFALYNLEAERASNTLFDIYGSNWTKFKSANLTLTELYSLKKETLSKSPLTKALDLQSKSAEISKKILKVKNKWNASLRGNMNIPVSTNSEPTSFLGVTVRLPIEDGGANKIQQSLVEKDLLEIQKQKASLERKFSTGFKQWKIFSQYQKENMKLLNSEYQLLEEILADQEIKRKTGRVSLQDYIVETLKKAELEIAIIVAGQESVEQAVNLMNEASLSCELVDLCSQLSSIENWYTYGQ